MHHSSSSRAAVWKLLWLDNCCRKENHTHLQWNKLNQCQKGVNATPPPLFFWGGGVDMTKISRLGSWYPNFGSIMFFAWPVDQHVALVKGPLTPGRYAPAVCGPWLTGQDNQRAVYLCCYVTPQLFLSLCLGLWPLESGISEIVAKGGGADIMRQLKSEVQNPTLFYNVEYPPKRDFNELLISPCIACALYKNTSSNLFSLLIKCYD